MVDTTGNFDVVRLYTLILSHIKKNPEVLSWSRAATGLGLEATIEDVAAKILDHVKIMRVFDFVGMREAISEIRDELEGQSQVPDNKGDTKDQPVVEVNPTIPEPDPEPKRTVVADSEDEDGEEEEEMLFDTTAEPTKQAPAVREPTINQQPEPAPRSEEQDTQAIAEKSNTVKFILIDNLAQVLNPLLKKDYIHGPSPLLLTPTRSPN